jgi:signal transduction histidine kinase
MVIENIGEQERKQKVVKLLQFTTSPFLIYYSVLAFSIGNDVYGYVTAILAAIMIAGIGIHYIKNKRLFIPLFNLNLYLFFICLLFLNCMIAYNARIEYFGWFFIYPIIAYYVWGRKEGLFLSLLCIISIGVILFFITPDFPESAFLQDIRFHYLLAFSAITVASFVYEKTRVALMDRQKLYQAELEHSRKKLKYSNEQLQDKAKEAERANRAKSEFLSNMSHELRTPLNHIIGFTELLFYRKVGKIDDVSKEYLQDVLQSSQHLLALINDVLDISKVEAGKMEFEPTKVNLSAIAEGSLNMLREKAFKHGISMKTEIDLPDPEIQADERKLKQILFNIISNAVKFTPCSLPASVTQPCQKEMVKPDSGFDHFV